MENENRNPRRSRKACFIHRLLGLHANTDIGWIKNATFEISNRFSMFMNAGKKVILCMYLSFPQVACALLCKTVSDDTSLTM